MARRLSAPQLAQASVPSADALSSSDDEASTLTSAPSLCHIKAASIPVTVKIKSKVDLEPQVSAPSYFDSLKQNEAPPFKTDGAHGELRPKIVTDTIMTDNDAILMVAASTEDPKDGLRKYLENFLLDKKIIVNTAILEKKFLVNFLKTTVDYAAQRDFSARKLSVLVTIYMWSHIYFKRYYWTSPDKLWNYFVDLMIRHTIQNSPDAEEIFEPDECYDIVTHFHTIYLSNLPLIHIIVFGAYRLKFMWPFKKFGR